MNKRQKILTIVAAAAFTLTTLFAPWDLTGGPANNSNALCYAPLFAPPALNVWSKRKLADGVFWSWLALAVVYAALYAALKDPVAPPQPRQDHQS